ncbi:MAG: VWA domain-containing protein [Thermoanaerobaculia bacterium]|nr:VWA domain-containing protein [Thermoanaerobaculia bacterium]
MTPRTFRVAILTFWLIAAGTASAPAQDADPATTSAEEQMSEFFEAIDVNIVNIEVFVTDKDGNPIAGLTKDDFTLLEDGDKQEISNFYAGEAVRATVDAQGQTLPLEGGQESAELPSEFSADRRLQLVLFIDNRNISPMSRNRVLEAVHESLFYDLDPDDRVTLVGYDGALNVRNYPSADVQSLARGLEEMATGSPTGHQRVMDKQNLLRQMSQFDLENNTGGTGGIGFNSEGGADVAGVEEELLTYAQREYDEVRASVASLSQFVSVLSGLPGRKALVYVSDGLPVRPAEALFQSFERATRQFGGGTINPVAEANRFNATPFFEDLGKQANSGRVTFYTILARGRTASISGAERSAFFSYADPTNLGQVWDESLETLDYSNQRGAMEILAQATGGRATLATLEFADALTALKEDFDSFYSLGYRSPSEDDKDHRIKVRVSNPDWKVRHRETQRRRTPDERMASATRSALMLDAGENPLGVRVEFGGPQPNEGKKKEWLVPIIVKFPISRLALVPGENFHEGKVSIYVGAQGPDGNMSPIQKMPAPVRIPNDKLLTAMSQVAGYRLTLLMRPGEHRVAVTVRDELADITSAALVVHAPDQVTAVAETAGLGAP